MTRWLLKPCLPLVCRQYRLRLNPVVLLQRAEYSVIRPVKPPGIVKEDEEVKARISQLMNGPSPVEPFPRLATTHENQLHSAISATDFSINAANLYLQSRSGAQRDPEPITVFGRVTATRKHGSGLVFLDLEAAPPSASADKSAQVMLNFAQMLSIGAVNGKDDFTSSLKQLQRGDWVSVKGHAGKSSRGQIVIIPTEIPQLMAPTLHPIPLILKDAEFQMRNRHVAQIVDPTERNTILLRHLITQQIRTSLNDDGFVEVSTPLLVADAGGAAARPFETVANEFQDLTLNLRVAPELFLKRLIVGGLEKVYELGPAFRNEGVDLTHNPEFTMCEFYAAMKDLDWLMHKTEKIFSNIVEAIEKQRPAWSALCASTEQWREPFRKIEFIPVLESKISKILPEWRFPDLQDTAKARESLQETLIQLAMPASEASTLPQILDDLSSRFLEPFSELPTFIIHHPECMSPLAKSFSWKSQDDPNAISHRVSARAELFFNGREYVNCYEEENSPFEQRRKFEEQAKYSSAADEGQETHQSIDESYLRALEWGMPPTAGWGAGIDRIVMLFAGKNRIADVLPFGTLRNVVALGNARKRRISVPDGANSKSEKGHQ